MYGLGNMLDIPQKNPLKYGFNRIEIHEKLNLKTEEPRGLITTTNVRKQGAVATLK